LQLYLVQPKRQSKFITNNNGVVYNINYYRNQADALAEINDYRHLQL
jgi:hypothetical protein